MEKKILAWHFSNAEGTLGYEDGRQIKRGRTLSVKGDPRLCNYGLHASKSLYDALKYAPGPYLWRVELSGTIIEGNDKLVATKRKALWGFDATPLLKKFARLCALDVIHLWDAPDVVRKFLESGDEGLRDAAWAAARAAARDAARDAAWDAARDAARAAAWDAARDAAWDAARDAARDAAWAAAWAAARAAARDAARDAQEKKQIKLLESLVAEFRK